MKRKIILMALLMMSMIGSSLTASASEQTVTAPGTAGVKVIATVGSTWEVTLPSEIVLVNNGNTVYNITAEGNVSGTQKLVVEGPAEVTMEQTGKTPVTATIKQTKTEWTHTELAVAGGSSTEVQATVNGLTAGEWVGTAQYKITLKDTTLLAAGAYNDEGVMVASWDDLTTTYGLDIAKDYSPGSYSQTDTSMYRVLNDNAELSTVSKIVVEPNLTSLGDGAFLYCANLKSVVLPDGITEIGDYMFLNSTGLETVNIPNDVTTLGTQAFGMCSNLTVTVPSTVTSVGDLAFQDVKQVYYDGNLDTSEWGTTNIN